MPVLVTTECGDDASVKVLEESVCGSSTGDGGIRPRGYRDRWGKRDLGVVAIFFLVI